MTRTSLLRQFRHFTFEGALATRELQSEGKRLGLRAAELVTVATTNETLDPTWYSPDLVAAARRMSPVYVRLYLFENKLRRFVEGVLRDSRGADWFERSVPERMRKEAARKQKEEGAARFHGHRGPDLPAYLGVSDWMKVIEENWGDFEPVLFQSHWSLGKLQELRLTRNSVAHMGEVTDDDIARLDLLIRDWNRQTG